jgi:HSP20 family protein
MKEKVKSGKGGGSSSFGGIFKGLADLVEKLGDFAEQGEELSKTGTLEGKRGMKGVFGFRVNVGLGDDGKVDVEPFGNVRRSKETGLAGVQEVREPLVDVFDEGEYVLVLAEMPGIGVEDLKTVLHDDILTIAAEAGEKKYRKEILLPRSFAADKLNINCNNGVVEIKLQD